MMNALRLLPLLPLLISCATPPVEHNTIRLTPPDALLLDIPEPVLSGRTWGDIAIYAAECKSALGQANLEKSLLREWATEPAE